MSQDGTHVELHERRLSAILAADVVGYSRLMGADEEGTLQALKAHRKAIVDPAIASHRGRIVKTTGDGLLVEFASAVDAVRCAVEVQRAMAERNEPVPPDRRIEFRIGINVGDIIGDGADIFGDGVNIAARLEAMAEPGGIYVSRSVRDPVRDKLSFSFEDLGEVAAKNIARPIHVFRVRHDREAAASAAVAPTPRAAPGPRGRCRARVLAAGGGRLVLAAHMDAGSAARFRWSCCRSRISAATRPDNYLATGVTDDLTTALSHIPGAFVIARATANTYRGKTEDIRNIGHDLNVRYVVRGSIQRLGAVLKVNAELGSTETGAQLWSDSFDQKIERPRGRPGADRHPHARGARTSASPTSRPPAACASAPPTPMRSTSFCERARYRVAAADEGNGQPRRLELYEQALARDPNAVLALSRGGQCTPERSTS